MVTVGLQGAEINGNSEKALQAAVDYVARFGGGTVQVMPGTYTLRNSVFIPSNVRIHGSGLDSVLMKEASVETTLSEDSDWYDQEITLKDASGFRIGDGVCIEAKDTDLGSSHFLKRTLVAQDGNRFKLDRPLRNNIWKLGQSKVSTLSPILTAEEAAGIVIENITVDGNKANVAPLNGNYGGGLWFQDCSRLTFRGVTSRNNAGDGISFQICHDVVVEDCHSHDNLDLGIHPGSGSQRPLMRNNKLERNGIGIFFCWGVKYGLAENNQIIECGTGISIGHRDNENLIRNNEVLRSTTVGLLFRPERGEGFTATGNHIEGNRFIDSGPEDAAAVDIQGVTAGNILINNEIRETRGAASRVGIRIGAEAGENTLEPNVVEGFAEVVLDLRKA